MPQTDAQPPHLDDQYDAPPRHSGEQYDAFTRHAGDNISMLSHDTTTTTVKKRKKGGRVKAKRPPLPLFECPICLDSCILVVALACGHSMCSYCTESSHKRKVILCPICRKQATPRTTTFEARTTALYNANGDADKIAHVNNFSNNRHEWRGPENVEFAALKNKNRKLTLTLRGVMREIESVRDDLEKEKTDSSQLIEGLKRRNYQERLRCMRAEGQLSVEKSWSTIINDEFVSVGLEYIEEVFANYHLQTITLPASACHTIANTYFVSITIDSKDDMCLWDDLECRGKSAEGEAYDDLWILATVSLPNLYGVHVIKCALENVNGAVESMRPDHTFLVASTCSLGLIFIAYYENANANVELLIEGSNIVVGAMEGFRVINILYKNLQSFLPTMKDVTFWPNLNREIVRVQILPEIEHFISPHTRSVLLRHSKVMESDLQETAVEGRTIRAMLEKRRAEYLIIS